MKIAVLGPVCRDEVFIDGIKHTNLGGIPFYIAKAFQSLGIDCTIFITHAIEDTDLVKSTLGDKHITYEHIYAEKTLSFKLHYSSKNPNERIHETIYVPNIIELKDVSNKLEEYDYIIMGPLFYGNIDPKIFEKFSHKKIIYGNFGMFNYAKDNKMVKDKPEKALEIMKYISYLFLDEKEIVFVSQSADLEKAIKNLKQFVPNIIVTKGSKGSEIFTKTEHYHIPAFKPNSLGDPTGAGDTFLGAFIAGLQFYNNLKKAGTFAAMAATCKIEHKGPLATSKEEINNRLKKILN
jgi:sugar/nucleoside kinase (ribokinase family)